MLTTSLHVASEKPSIGLKTDGVELLRTSRPSGLRPWDQILGDWKTASRMDLFPGGTPLKGMKGGFFLGPDVGPPDRGNGRLLRVLAGRTCHAVKNKQFVLSGDLTKAAFGRFHLSKFWLTERSCSLVSFALMFLASCFFGLSSSEGGEGGVCHRFPQVIRPAGVV